MERPQRPPSNEGVVLDSVQSLEPPPRVPSANDDGTLPAAALEG